jgi:hypothetical protein
LKAIGASALATAAVVFGRAEAAQANYACCALRASPSSWSSCANGSNVYIWQCTQTTPYGVCYRYECCEANWKSYPHYPYYCCGISAWRQVGIC